MFTMPTSLRSDQEALIVPVKSVGAAPKSPSEVCSEVGIAQCPRGHRSDPSLITAMAYGSADAHARALPVAKETDPSVVSTAIEP